jgi:hypothetical protein
MDLSRWSRNDYRTTFFADLLLHLGGNPYRCPYCRLNFVSFRKRKERYVPRKRKHGSPSGSQAQAKGTQLQP